MLLEHVTYHTAHAWAIIDNENMLAARRSSRPGRRSREHGRIAALRRRLNTPTSTRLEPLPSRFLPTRKDAPSSSLTGTVRKQRIQFNAQCNTTIIKHYA